MAYLEPLVCTMYFIAPNKKIAFFFVTGKHPCLSCEIVLEEMQLPPIKRRCYPPRTLQGILESHKEFVATGGNKKHVMHFLNCLTEPIFDIPITQVCMHRHLCAIIACITI